MKHYAIGNIFGHIDELKTLLNKIDFIKNGDIQIYLLGNYTGFDETSIKSLLYIMKLDKTCKNVKCLIGSQDLLLMEQLYNYNHTSDVSEVYYDKNFLYNKGGRNVFNNILKYGVETQIDVERWLDNLDYRVDLDINNKIVTLVHSDAQYVVDREDKEKFNTIRKKAVLSDETRENCNEIILRDIINNSINIDNNIEKYRKKYGFDILITGSTSSNEKSDKVVIFGNCVIDIDCGSRYMDSIGFGRLAALDLETQEAIYV